MKLGLLLALPPGIAFWALVVGLLLGSTVLIKTSMVFFGISVLVWGTFYVCINTER